jgi:hypothetical protein
MEIELRVLDQKYLSLRILDAYTQARLTASLASLGQQSACLVIEQDGKLVLIDGYRRVAALRGLRQDTVACERLAMTESEALLFRHRMANVERRSALEEAWLLRELHEVFGLPLLELARRFIRSKSWVSRRLALVRELPASVQDLVREGRLQAQAAMKHLVPLARGNELWVERLARCAADAKLSVRELGEVVSAWLYATPELRERIVAQPDLFLRVRQSVQPAPSSAPTPERALLHDIERLAALARRIRAECQTLAKERPTLPSRDVILVAWKGATQEIDLLGEFLLYGLDRAR